MLSLLLYHAWAIPYDLINLGIRWATKNKNSFVDRFGTALIIKDASDLSTAQEISFCFFISFLTYNLRLEVYFSRPNGLSFFDLSVQIVDHFCEQPVLQ
jgi:hypothetical protein